MKPFLRKSKEAAQKAAREEAFRISRAKLDVMVSEHPVLASILSVSPTLDHYQTLTVSTDRADERLMFKRAHLNVTHHRNMLSPVRHYKSPVKHANGKWTAEPQTRMHVCTESEVLTGHIWEPGQDYTRVCDLLRRVPVEKVDLIVEITDSSWMALNVVFERSLTVTVHKAPLADRSFAALLQRASFVEHVPLFGQPRWTEVGHGETIYPRFDQFMRIPEVDNACEQILAEVQKSLPLADLRSFVEALLAQSCYEVRTNQADLELTLQPRTDNYFLTFKREDVAVCLDVSYRSGSVELYGIEGTIAAARHLLREWNWDTKFSAWTRVSRS